MSLKNSRQQGFTLIEVLVAFLVLGIGLLGMGSLMTQSVRANQGAAQLGQAVFLAQDMADRIRANMSAQIDSNADGRADTSDYLLAAAATSGCVASGTALTGCGIRNMARNDRYEWEQLLSTTLVSGQGVVCLDSTPDDGTNSASAACDTTGTVLAVKIFWDGNRDGTLEQRYVLRVSL